MIKATSTLPQDRSKKELLLDTLNVWKDAALRIPTQKNGARESMLRDISETQIDIGYISDALLLLTKIEDTKDREYSLLHAVKKLAAMRCYDSAHNFSLEIGDPGKLAVALTEISRQQAIAGLFFLAKGTANQIENKEFRIEPYVNLVSAQVRLGFSDLAQKTASELDSNSDQSRVIDAVIEELSQIGDFKEALRVHNKHKASLQRSSFGWSKSHLARRLESIAKGQALAGLFGDAIKTASLIHTDFSKDSALSEISKAQAVRHQFSESLETALKIGHPNRRESALCYISQAQADVGLIDDALATMSRVVEDRPASEGLEEIVSALLQGSDFSKASKTAEMIVDDFFRDRAYAMIVNRLANAKEFSKAQGVAHKIVDDAKKANAMCDISEIQALAGLYIEARETAIGIGNEFYRDSAFSKLSKALLDADFLDEAMDATTNISSSSTLSIILPRIAAAQFRAGSMDQARKTINRISVADFRASAFAKAALVDELIPEFIDEAMSIVLDCSQERIRFALVGIAEDQCEAGFFREALDTLGHITDPWSRGHIAGKIVQKLTENRT